MTSGWERLEAQAIKLQKAAKRMAREADNFDDYDKALRLATGIGRGLYGLMDKSEVAQREVDRKLWEDARKGIFVEFPPD